MRYHLKQYCKDYEKIENYEAAKKDNFVGWECHHRLETHNSDGERRLVDISHKELKALGMYYNRPPEELIFLTVKEHNAFNKGKHHTEETRNKMREAKKNVSEETRKRLSDSWDYDKHFSTETRKKIGEASEGNTNVRGTRWYNNGKISKRAKECPPGFVPGRLRK